MTDTGVKIVVVVPTRGDRPVMVANMLRMMADQTVRPVGLVLVDDRPTGPNVKDLTLRYRLGVSRARQLYPDADLIAFVEDDDWYSPKYLEEWAQAWVRMGRPSLMGPPSTIYYSLAVRSRAVLDHPGRSSMFCTFCTPELADRVRWPSDDTVFLDVVLWERYGGEGRQWSPNSWLAVGIKGHGEGGQFGGIGHKSEWVGYKNGPDPDMQWLRDTVDARSFDFYKSMSEKIINIST